VRALLDTHAFIWWVRNDAALSPRARATIEDGSNVNLFSLASAWEIAIKVSLGKLSVHGRLEQVLPEQLAANGLARCRSPSRTSPASRACPSITATRSIAF
jgi:PIN domain nuclease of toxin-antitoxin system